MTQIRELLNFSYVTRYHTVRGNGADQTIGQHSFHLAFIIAYLNPDASARLLRAALYHDLAEGITGDVPASAKWEFPDISNVMRRAEQHVEIQFGVRIVLNQEDSDWLQSADMLELFLYSQYRAELKDADPMWNTIIDRARNWFAIREWVPKEIMEIVNEDPLMRS